MMSNPKTFNLCLREGLTIAIQRWGEGNSKKVLCLHGWLDNSNSFAYIGENLAKKGFEVTACDYIGHGKSSTSVGHQSYVDYIVQTRELIQKLDYTKANLIGHSMGAGIAIMLSGSFPETVSSLVCIDGFGPVCKPAHEAPKNLRKAIDARLSDNKRGANGPKEYSDIEAAIQARVKAVGAYPGSQTISYEAASLLVARGTVPFSETCQTKSVKFTHDQRLYLPSPVYTTEEMALAYIDNITAPTLAIQAENGWPIDSTVYDVRLELLRKKGLLNHIKLPGSHHLHLDPDTAENVFLAIQFFLENR